MNYFLYIVGTTSIEHDHKIGDCGVGRTSIGPGISDCPYGLMLIAPANYVHDKLELVDNVTPEILKTCICEYFGHHDGKKEVRTSPDTVILRTPFKRT
jgi:hypothetical protein